MINKSVCQRWITWIALLSLAFACPTGADPVEIAENSIYDEDVLVSPQFPTLLPRVFISGGNSTLIPISAATSMLVSTIAIVGLVLGAIYVFGTLFNPAIRSGYGGGLFGPGLYGQQGYNGFYNPNYYQQGQQQAQTYSYEPYSKLGTYSERQSVQSRLDNFMQSSSIFVSITRNFLKLCLSVSEDNNSREARKE